MCLAFIFCFFGFLIFTMACLTYLEDKRMDKEGPEPSYLGHIEYDNQCVINVFKLVGEPGDRAAGEQFFQKYTLPIFHMCVAQGGTLIIDLDGAIGYSSGFLETAFGSLGTFFTKHDTDNHLKVVCNDEPYLVRDVFRYIDERYEDEIPSYGL